MELCEKGEAIELPAGLRSIETCKSSQHTVLIPVENDPPENKTSHAAVLAELARFLDRHAP